MTNAGVEGIKLPSAQNATDHANIVSDVFTGWSASSEYNPDSVPAISRAKMVRPTPINFWMLGDTHDTKQVEQPKGRMWYRSLDAAETNLGDELGTGVTNVIATISWPKESNLAVSGHGGVGGDDIAYILYTPTTEPLDVDAIRGLGWTAQPPREVMSDDFTEDWLQFVEPRCQQFLKDAVSEFLHALDLKALSIAADCLLLNGTAPERKSRNQEIRQRLEQLISVADVEEFEVGMESHFSQGLQELFVTYAIETFAAVRERTRSSVRGAEVTAEMLRWVSRQDEPTIRVFALETLITGLTHSSSLVRDTAALGLATLDEAQASYHLEMALERETVPELREDLKDLLQSLQE